MPTPSTHQPKTVLIVDQSDDSRDVLRTILARRGVGIYEAPEARQGLELLRRHRPEIVVLDLEAVAADDDEVCAAFQAEMKVRPAEMVVLGNLRDCRCSRPTHLVRKPYHYGPLIRKIEQLIERSTCDDRPT
jgi:CheY-like chemotaxis protein